MQRLLNHFKKLSPFLHPDAVEYLRQHGRLRVYQKGQVYPMQQDKQLHWCFILDGMVGKVNQDSKDQSHIDLISTAPDYFVGMGQSSCYREEAYDIVFLQDSLIYEIGISDLQHLVERYPCINRVYDVLKQHKLDKTEDIVYIRSLYFELRVAALYQLMPTLAGMLTVEQKKNFLRISNNRDYYAALRYFLNRQ